MPANKKVIMIIVAFIVIALIITLGLVAPWLPLNITGESVLQAHLVPPNKAAEIAGFPLVGSATNASYYSVYGGLQYGKLYMRVTVALPDITN